MEPSVAQFVEGLCTGANGACSEFFSRANLERLHSAIVQEVQLKHGHCIQRQSEQQLLLLMRSMWARWGSAGAGVDGANQRVVQEATRIIKTNIDMHERATRFLHKNPEPLAWGENTSVRGTKLS